MLLYLHAFIFLNFWVLGLDGLGYVKLGLGDGSLPSSLTCVQQKRCRRAIEAQVAVLNPDPRLHCANLVPREACCILEASCAASSHRVTIQAPCTVLSQCIHTAGVLLYVSMKDSHPVLRRHSGFTPLVLDFCPRPSTLRRPSRRDGT